MAEDYDYDGDAFMDLDDGWIYVEDEFDIADELAEGQIADPGYCGTNYEIAMEGYEFDLFAYWDDLEYADDAYWDYGLPSGDDKTGEKRKRGTDAAVNSTDKRRKTQAKQLKGTTAHEREAEPLLFRSRRERNLSLKQDAPRSTEKPFAFMANWRERFANADGAVSFASMPAAMRQAAEAQEEDGAEMGDDEEGDWEDEDDGEEGGLELDPEMLKTILRKRLGAARLDGMDEGAFMETIQKMMPGEAEGDAAGDLANALLGKVTADGGDEAVSGWLSQQGVSLEEDDDTSSVATAELPQGSQRPSRKQNEVRPDTATSVAENGFAEVQDSSHNITSNGISKKRAADDEKPNKRQKKVKFDVPSSSPEVPQSNLTQGAAEHPTTDDSLASEIIIDNGTSRTRTRTAASNTKDIASNSIENSAPKSRKRKATTDETEQKPAAKKTRSRELAQLGASEEIPSPAPPAKRTRSARAKSGK